MIGLYEVGALVYLRPTDDAKANNDSNSKQSNYTNGMLNNFIILKLDCLNEIKTPINPELISIAYSGKHFNMQM